MINKGINDVRLKISLSKDKKYYNNENEAKAEIISLLKDKYKIDFSLAGSESYEKTNVGIVFSTNIKDKNGLMARATLPQDKSVSLKKELNAGVASGLKDTYLETYYIKKAHDTINPLIQGEPFEKYFIDLDGVEQAIKNLNSKNYLSLSMHDYFNESGDQYKISIILAPGKSKKEYAEIIYPFYEKMITKQKNPFYFTIYADNVEIFSISYINASYFNSKQSFDKVMNEIDMKSTQKIPKEQYLKNAYYNGN